MPFSYKTLFLLEADTFSLVEIKRLDIQSDNPGEVYFWFRFDKATSGLEPLEFVSMAKEGDEQQREFRQGALRFDREGGAYRAAGAEEQPLRVAAATAVPVELHTALLAHFTAE